MVRPPTPTRPPTRGRPSSSAAGPRRPRAQPPEPAGVRARRRRRQGETFASAKNIAKGAYILAEAPGGTPDVIFIATGSEVQIAVDAREKLRRRASTPASSRRRAWNGSRSRATRTASRCSRRPSRLASRSRPGSRSAGAATSAMPDAASPSSTSAHPPTTRPSTRSST